MATPVRKAVLYGRRWRAARLNFLAEHPLCVFHLKRDRIVPSTVVDHITPHERDPVLFWDEANWQALCQPCHDQVKQREELLAPRVFSLPSNLSPSAISCHIVVGPPGSGKTTFVRTNAKQGDVVIDLDDLLECLGFDRYESSMPKVRCALTLRDDLLRSLSRRVDGEAWFVVVAPTVRERKAWLMALGPRARLHVMDPGRKQCLVRVMEDQQRSTQVKARHIAMIEYHYNARVSTTIGRDGWPIDPLHPVYEPGKIKTLFSKTRGGHRGGHALASKRRMEREVRG